MNVETRHTAGTVEIRKTTAGMPKIGGYALKYNRMSQNLGGFVEQIAPGAFDRSLNNTGNDVLARFQHDDLYLLGRTSSGTLRLTPDDVGVDYEADLPETDYARNLAALAERGDVRFSSFAFRTLEDDWTVTDDGFPLRTLRQAQLVDVAPVVTPAYMDTSSGLRSLAAVVNLAEEEMAEAIRAGHVVDLLRGSNATVIDLAPNTPAERSAETESTGPGETHPALLVAQRRLVLLDKRLS